MDQHFDSRQHDGTLLPACVAPAPPKPKLLDQVRDALRCKHYSIRTEQSYIDWIKRYIFFHDRKHPADMNDTHISAFLTHLAVQKWCCNGPSRTPFDNAASPSRSAVIRCVTASQPI